MISDDEYLERIVAGIHSQTSDGADVLWNEIINGRQFDVVVRFKLGTLSYLVLIEVKNRTRKASASDVEAFTLKAKDQNANKSVFVTTAGYQSGAIEVAKRHGVDLFTVSFSDKKPALSPQTSWVSVKQKGVSDPPHMEVGEASPMNAIEEVALIYSDGRNIPLPDEPSQMNYYAQKTTVSGKRTLHEILQSVPIPDLELNETFSNEFAFEDAIDIQPPDELFFPSGTVRALRYKVTTRLGRLISGNIRVEPTAFTSPIVYTDILTGEAIQFTAASLPLGVKRVCANQFYFGLHPLRYYYCASVEDSVVHWKLIESFQNAILLRGSFTQQIRYSRYYIPVADEKILKRLRERLKNFDGLEKRNQSSPS